MNATNFKPVDLDVIQQRIQKDDVGKFDFKVVGADLDFTERGTLTIRGGGSIVPLEYKLQDWAFGQLCTKLSVPSSYLRKCPITGNGGQKAQLDLWKQKMIDKKLMVRVKNVSGLKVKDKPVRGFARAVLAQSYGALDNRPLWNNLRPYLEKNGLLVQSAHLNDLSFHVRALYPDGLSIPAGNDKPGLHFVGLHTANSEVGARYLSGDFVIWRQVCTNGMVVMFHNQSLFRVKHQRVNVDELKMQIVSGLRGVHEHKLEVMEGLKDAKLVKIKDPKKFLENLLKDKKQPAEIVDQAILAYEREPLPSRFGVAQAITAAARKLSMDKRLELEALAGRWLLGRGGKADEDLEVQTVEA